MLVKQGVKQRQIAVTLANRVTNNQLCLFGKQPWFASLGVNVSMTAEEWQVNCCLIPACEELAVGITEESADISAADCVFFVSDKKEKVCN